MDGPPGKNGNGHSHEFLESLKRRLADLVDIALHNPVEALPKIKDLNQQVIESGQANDEAMSIVHFLWFLAFGKLSIDKYETLGHEGLADLRPTCERAVSEYQAARQLTARQETETYQREVIVEVGNWFPKKTTQLVTETRTVTKHRIDETYGRLLEESGFLDSLLRILEKCSPGKVHELLGETKIKYLAGDNRLGIAHFIAAAIEDGRLPEHDVQIISDLPLAGSGAVRAVMLAGGFSGPAKEGDTMLVSLWDGMNPGEGNCTGMVEIQKTSTTWVVK